MYADNHFSRKVTKTIKGIIIIVIIIIIIIIILFHFIIIFFKSGF